MRYVFHPEALAEYSEAVRYYTEQRVEVAQAFINTIEDTVYRIRESPDRYAPIDDDVRRCMARKFPYGVLILAVMHCSQEPGYWKNRR
jgi:toxin ParE1/3/4